MSANDPGSPAEGRARAGWRAKAAGSPSTAPATGRKAAGWAEKKGADYQRTVRRHKFRIAAWSLLFLGLIAAFILYLLPTPVPTPFLVAVVTDYEAPVPPNAWAEEDAEGLQDLDRQRVLKCIRIPPARWESKESGIDELRRQLESTKPGGPRKDLVVMYVSMPGVVDGKGEPCLIPPGASPWKSDQWLRVRELLKQPFLKNQSDKRADQVKRLLILDAARVGNDWNLGLLYNSFADRLPAVVREVNNPSLYVLNSAGPGQVGWAAPELKGSVFGYFLRQGLNGAADVEVSGNGDKVVSLQELYRYLRAYVGQWVTENRDDVQEPMLLPDGADFPVVFQHPSKRTTIPTPGAPDPRWKQIGLLWKKHAELSRTVPYRSRPLAWEAFQQKLLRLEQLVEAGKAYEAEYSAAEKQAESLAAALAHDPIAGDVAAYSLPLASRFRAWPAAAQLAGLPAPWRQPPKKPAEKPQAKPAGKPAEKPAEKPAPVSAGGPGQPYSYLAASAASWDWLLADPSHVAWLPAALKFVDGGEQPPAHDLVEVHFLRMLAEHLDPPLWKTALERVHRALLARQVVEQAAAPEDPRVLYWAEPLVDQADQARRSAEDRLFVGSPAVLNEADGFWEKAIGEDGKGGEYRRAIDRAGEVAAAFQVRDRAWAELPYLAQWILARQETASADAQLRTAIDDTGRLAAQLDAHLADRQWPPEAAALATRLDGELQALLNRRFQSECTELKTAGEDKETLRRIAAVLAVPLLSGYDRNQLRNKYLSIAGRITAAHTKYEVAVTEEALVENAAAKQARQQAVDRLQAWEEHPLVLMLESAGVAGVSPADVAPTKGAAQPGATPGQRAKLSEESLLTRLARQEADVRRRLSGLPESAQKCLEDTAKRLEAKGEQPPKPADVRAGDSMADRLTRAAAAFLDAGVRARLRGKPDIEPADWLRRLDLHYLMLWQGSRTADDFWGPAQGRGPEGATSYFAPVARAYGESAEKLRQGVSRWKAAVDQLAQAARQGVQPTVEPKWKYVFVDQQDQAVRHEVSVMIPPGVPPGTAAVYLQDSEGLLPLWGEKRQPLRRMSIAVTPQGSPPTAKYSIPNNPRLGAQQAHRLQAVALYRGHVRTDDFYVSPATGLDIEYARPDYPKPTIVVRGEERQTTAVMFILDCSGSMDEPVTIRRKETVGGTVTVEPEQTTRLNLARDALKDILRGLTGRENPFDVGLIVYGHRVGWDPDAPQRPVILNPQPPPPFVPRPAKWAQIYPYNDVELVQPLGRFTQNELKEVTGKLAGLYGMGETPLYLSIIKAIEHLRREAGAGQRRIVVITDGVNYQSGGDKRSGGDVERELNKPGNEGIRLDVVGLNLDPERVEADLSRQETKRRYDELKALAEKKGKFYYTSDRDALVEALRRSLALSQYVVEALPSKRPVSPELELNTPYVFERPPAQPTDYLVRLTDPDHAAESRVTVEGGEALELFLPKERGGHRLVYHPYTKALRDPPEWPPKEKIPAPQDPEKRSFYVAAHEPRRKGTAAESAEFYVSVQNADAEQFSPRPQEAWIQIRPVVSAATAGVMEYAFYDMRFLSGCPVPVLTCLAPQWPEAAKEAEIQVWCKLQQTPPEVKLPVSSFRQRKPRLDEAPQVSFEIETEGGSGKPLRVVVTERHPAGSNLYSVKVEMQPAPGRIVRRYIGSVGVIRHSFFYDNATAAEVENYDVLLTARKRLEDGAITPPRPLKVTVPVD
jgi:Mg-chelatase subunit ChlD